MPLLERVERGEEMSASRLERWRKASGVMCDRKVSARMKGKVYKTVVRQDMLYGLETVALRKRQEAELIVLLSEYVH